MTGHPVVRRDLPKERDRVPAERQLRFGAAGVEGAARGDVDRAGGLALEDRGVEGALGGGPGHRGEQASV